MVSPNDVVAFHADYDSHPDDRIRLFGAIAGIVPRSARVLYPGSYVDIAASVWFDDVVYVDTDKRAAKFFGHSEAVASLVAVKRRTADIPAELAAISFHHLDYTTPLPETEESFDLLVSLYAGFVSEHCSNHLRVGGTLLVNPSHGDAAMASIDPDYELTGVIMSRSGAYAISTDALDTFLIPKNEQTPTIESLHQSGRGIGYTRSAFAYLFTRQR